MVILFPIGFALGLILVAILVLTYGGDKDSDEKVVSLSKKDGEVVMNSRDKETTQEMIDLYNKIKHQLK